MLETERTVDSENGAPGTRCTQQAVAPRTLVDRSVHLALLILRAVTLWTGAGSSSELLPSPPEPLHNG